MPLGGRKIILTAAVFRKGEIVETYAVSVAGFQSAALQIAVLFKKYLFAAEQIDATGVSGVGKRNLYRRAAIQIQQHQKRRDILTPADRRNAVPPAVLYQLDIHADSECRMGAEKRVEFTDDGIEIVRCAEVQRTASVDIYFFRGVDIMEDGGPTSHTTDRKTRQTVISKVKSWPLHHLMSTLMASQWQLYAIREYYTSEI